MDLAFAEVQLEKTNQVDSQTMDSVLENEKIQFKGFLMLHHMKQNSYLTKYDAKTIAMDADIYFEDIDKKKDSLSFYDAKEIKFNGKKITYFFFKKINIEENSYNTNQQKISGIAFITENGKINIKEYCKLNAKTYLEEKEIDAIIKSMIDESLNDNHRRASYGKLKNGNQFSVEDYLEEY